MCHGAERLEESPFVLVSETEGPARASFSCPEAASPANAVCLAQTSWFWISNLQMQRWDLYHFKMQQFYRRTTGSHAWLTLVIVSRTFPWLGNKFIYAVWIYIYQIWMCLCEYCVCFKPQNVFVSLFLGQAQNYWWLFISLCLHLYLFFPNLNISVLSNTILFLYLLYQRLWTSQHQNDNNLMTTKHLIIKSIYVFDSTPQSVKSNYYVLKSFGIYFISDYTSNGRRISFACFTCRFLMIAFRLNFI